jgi:CheY-like chemotaxis protein
LKNILEVTGNEVLTTDNGKDRLFLILSEKFDLILLDITMPEFSGIDIVRYLDDQNKLKDNCILFLTVASIPDSDLQEWIDKGVKTCLRKPVEMADIFEHINEVRMV